METKFRNKYRTESSRLQNWDYAWNAAYYVTICTKNRDCCFGEIDKGEMNLSRVGEIADKYWKTIPKHFPFVLLDEYVIMPNHIHGIIQINNPNDLKYKNINQDRIETPGRDAINRVSTISIKSGGITGNKNPMFHNNLSRIMRCYKGRVSFETHKIYPDFAWQPRFYDHVIRNNESFVKIRYYIWDNLKNWLTDQMNPENQETSRHE